MALHAVQKPLANFIRAVLLMALYVPLFSPRAYSSGTGDTIYTNVLKVRLGRIFPCIATSASTPLSCGLLSSCCRMQAIGCLILFTFANVLSTLLAKIMASHFHKAAHFSKMQQAIRKARPSLGAPAASSDRHGNSWSFCSPRVSGPAYIAIPAIHAFAIADEMHILPLVR